MSIKRTHLPSIKFHQLKEFYVFSVCLSSVYLASIAAIENRWNNQLILSHMEFWLRGALHIFTIFPEIHFKTLIESEAMYIVSPYDAYTWTVDYYAFTLLAIILPIDSNQRLTECLLQRKSTWGFFSALLLFESMFLPLSFGVAFSLLCKSLVKIPLASHLK